MTYILTLFPVLNKLYYKPLCIPYLPQLRKFLFFKGCVCVIVFLSPYLTTALPTGGSQKMLIAHKSKWIIMKYPCYHSLFNNTSNWNPMPLCRYAWYSPTYRKLFLYSLYLPFPSLGGKKKKKRASLVQIQQFILIIHIVLTKLVSLVDGKSETVNWMGNGENTASVRHAESNEKW